MTFFIRLVVAVALPCAFTAGCATTAKLNSFAELSKAGIAYSQAANALVAQAAAGSIDADTASLLIIREFQPDAGERRKALTDQSKALRKQLALLADIRRHQSLIKEYFVALGALADAGDADSAIGVAAGDTIAALGRLSPSFAGQKIGEQSIGEFVGQAAPLVVADLRLRALERELRTNGTKINHELLVSEALMAFLAEKIIADDAAVQGPKESEAVFSPFTKSGGLPADWPAKRTAFLLRAVDLSAVNMAQDSARKLRAALIAASEGHLSSGQLHFLVSDLGAIVEVLEGIKGTPRDQE